jgi:hypothetical protein
MYIISNRNSIVGYENCDYGLTCEWILLLRVILPLKSTHPIDPAVFCELLVGLQLKSLQFEEALCWYFELEFLYPRRWDRWIVLKRRKGITTLGCVIYPKERRSQGIRGLWTKAEWNCLVRFIRNSLWWSVRMCYSKNTVARQTQILISRNLNISFYLCWRTSGCVYHP